MGGDTWWTMLLSFTCHMEKLFGTNSNEQRFIGCIDLNLKYLQQLPLHNKRQQAGISGVPPKYVPLRVELFCAGVSSGAWNDSSGDTNYYQWALQPSIVGSSCILALLKPCMCRNQNNLGVSAGRCVDRKGHTYMTYLREHRYTRHIHTHSFGSSPKCLLIEKNNNESNHHPIVNYKMNTAFQRGKRFLWMKLPLRHLPCAHLNVAHPQG